MTIFVASPGDLSVERALVERVIKTLQDRPEVSRRLVLRPLLWETMTPALIGITPEAMIEEFMGASDQADVFVMLSGNRLGSRLQDPRTGRWFPSGTEYELDTAYRSYLERQRPRLLLYRRTPRPDEVLDPVEQDRLVEFWKLFQGPEPKYQGLPKTFTSPETLRDHLDRDLGKVIYEIIDRITGSRINWRGVAGAVLAMLVLGVGVYYGQKWRVARQVDTIVETALASQATDWKPVTERLVGLGSWAVDPVFEALRKPAVFDGIEQTPTVALVQALAAYAADGARRPVCERLFRVLKLGLPAPPYPKSTHRIVISEGLVKAGCPGHQQALCDYLRHVSPTDFIHYTDELTDLRDAAAAILGDAQAATCAKPEPQ